MRRPVAKGQASAPGRGRVRRAFPPFLRFCGSRCAGMQTSVRKSAKFVPILTFSIPESTQKCVVDFAGGNSEDRTVAGRIEGCGAKNEGRRRIVRTVFVAQSVRQPPRRKGKHMAGLLY